MSTATTSRNIRVSTMEQREAALLCEQDRVAPIGMAVTKERLAALFGRGLALGRGGGSLYDVIVSDPEYIRLNVRQKAFVLAEIDLRNCPVNVGDNIEMLVNRPDSASLERGDLQVVRAIENVYVSTTDGWVINHYNYRLVTPLEFPSQPGEMVTGDYQRIHEEAMRKVESFVRHSNDTGDWGSCTCRVVMDGVDFAIGHFGEYGLDRAWAQTPEGKAWVGQVLRWMRATVVERFLSQNPDLPSLQVHIPDEPMPERNLSAPVVIDGNQVAAMTIEELVAKVDELTRRVERLDTSNRELRQWQVSAMRDFETANDILNSQARDRDWCSEYEDVLERINNRCTVLQWEPRTREVEVMVRGHVTIPFSVSVTVEVGPDDDAEEMATNTVENNYSVRDLATSYGDHYSAEMEIDEAEVE